MSIRKEGKAGPAPPAEAPEPRKAALVRLEGEGGFPFLELGWNPSAYRLRKRPPGSFPGGAGEEFDTELFLDTTQESGEKRDARSFAEALRSWMEPLEGGLLPPRVLFAWGPFRFAGTIESIEEEWIRFDPDGTPVRGKLHLVLRS